MIPIYKPYLPSNSLHLAHRALDSTWLSSQGEYLPVVQEKLQELLKVKYVLPLNNGTSACHLVAKCLNHHLGSPNSSQIIVPNNVYVAAWNGFLFDKNFELIPIDANLDTWNFDLQTLEEKIYQYPKAAVLIVHNVGNIINVPELKRKYPTTTFVEDNCEGLLGTYEGLQAGTASFVSAISFFGNKNITSGEGGAFVTNDENAYLFAKCLQGQGQSSKRFIHFELGYNYRMTNIQAAILCGQLEVLPEIIEKKNYLFEEYRKAFNNREDIKIQTIEVELNTHTPIGCLVFVLQEIATYDFAESFFKTRGIEIRPMFYSIDVHHHLNGDLRIFNCDNENATLLNRECFILPSFPELNTANRNKSLCYKRIR